MTLDRSIFLKSSLMSYVLIVIGSFMAAAGYALFADPLKIVPGGVYGLAIIIHHLFDLPTGAVGLCFNVPLFIWGIWVLGPRFGAKTFIGTVLMAVFIDLLNHFFGNTPYFTDNLMLASIVSGVLIGGGIGLIFKAKATTGGTDIVAQIINKYTRTPIGKLLIIVDTFVVITGVVTFRNWELAFYALITIFILGKVVDSFLMGGNYKKAIFLISDKSEEIGKQIIHRMDRGGTFFSGKGMYNGKEKQVIFTILNHRDLSILGDMAKEIDPDTFITAFNTNEIYGNGFKSIHEMDE